MKTICLGDSIAYYGDDPGGTYPGRLEAVLDADPTLASIEVLDAGVRGYTNYQEMMFLRLHGVALEPDPVGVSFCLNDLHRFTHRPDFANAWQDAPRGRVERQFDEMHRLAEQNGFPLFVIVFPFGDQLRPEYLERDRDYVMQPRRKLAEICRERDIPLLDLFDSIDPEIHLLDDRIHPTSAGRQWAAERVAEFLVKEGLLPPKADVREAS